MRALFKEVATILLIVEGSRLRELNASHEKTIKEISRAIGLV